MTPRGIRNRNPLNIIQSGAQWQGKLSNPDDSRFEQFESDFYGIRAGASLLLSYQDKHGLRTVRGVINRWAPPVENNTSAYVTTVAKEIGVGVDEQLDLHRFTTLAPIVTAIIRHENGQQPYSADLIASAVNSALGTESRPQPAIVSTPTQATQPRTRMDALPTLGAIASAINPIAGLLVSAFSPLIREKITKVVDGHAPGLGTQVSDILIDRAQEVSGKSDPLEAVAVVRQNPEMVKQVEQAASDWLAQLAPLLDRVAQYEKDARADTMADANSAPARKMQLSVWVIPLLIGLAGVALLGSLVGVSWMLLVQIQTDPSHRPDAVLAGLATMLFMAVTSIAQAPYRSIFGAWFDSNAAQTGTNAINASKP